MSVLASASLVLVCHVGLPLAAGPKPEDRQIAVIRSALPAAMVESLRGEAPRATIRFIDEPSDRHEWVIAGNRPGPDGLFKALRLTAQPVPSYYSHNVRVGDAQMLSSGEWTFKPIGSGACRVESATPESGKPTR
jgi:hypothetical protein